MSLLSAIYFIALFLSLVHCACYEPSWAFPPPALTPGLPELDEAFSTIKGLLKNILANDAYPTSSFSIEVTSSQQTLWSHHHTAVVKNSSRPDAPVVNGTTGYRIASITKAFTVLAIIQQHAAGKLSLDDRINKYIPEFKQKQRGHLPWHSITLRSLASQLSGIPNNWAQVDMLNFLPDPLALGLPPATKEGLAPCDEYTNYNIPCTRTDLIHDITQREPLFAPNAQSTYSNTAFELLGLAIENATGQSCEDYIETYILDYLNMTTSSFTPPPDTSAAIPLDNNYWGIDEGVQNPTGGLYSTSSDLSTFLRYILTHYNGLTPTLNWLQPASWATGMQSFYGMPWEIFRTSSILPNTKRPVTFVTKSGGLPGYVSIIMVLPEYELGVTILVAGAGQLLGEIREIVTIPLVQAAEVYAQRTLHSQYKGIFTSKHINSSLTLSHTPSKGLHVTSWISNSTDTLAAFGKLIRETGQAPSDHWSIQLVPTLLYFKEKEQEGEVWRMLVVPERLDEAKGVWDEFCITHVDNERYAGIPLNEIIMYRGSGGKGRVESVDLSAFRIVLQRDGNERDEDEEMLRVQPA